MLLMLSVSRQFFIQICIAQSLFLIHKIELIWHNLSNLKHEDELKLVIKAPHAFAG